MKQALITGITGQDGSYLCELLLGKGYRVHGLVRRASTFSTDRIDHLYEDPQQRDRGLELHYGDLTDGASLTALVAKVRPDEIYHLGAQSHVKVSFENPLLTVQVDAVGTLRLLEAVRHLESPARIYHAASSEMFGVALESPQRETTPLNPQSPYACAKAYAFWQCRGYRQSYGMHVSNGILFNHESPRRGETFVTRKVTRAAARIRLGLQRHLYLGNLDARRDWGFAGDYVEAMWRMLQQDVPDDYVVATGEQHSVRELVELSFTRLGLDPDRHVRQDPRYLRPAEVPSLCGDARKARAVLGWQPTIGFEALIDMMLAHDLRLAERERLLAERGLAEPPAAELRA